MSDAGAVLLAVSTAAGALVPSPVPLAVALAVVLFAFVRRTTVLLCVGCALLASGLSARAWEGLRPIAPRVWSGVATLAGDPDDVHGAVRVDVRIGDRIAEAWARGEAGGRLRARLAGERVAMVGRLERLPRRVRARLARRHVAARFNVEAVGGWSPGDPVTRLANGLRRALVAGAESLPQQHRALFAGFVLGDDREQSVETVDDFRASGLAHLLVVSGQNVAFVLAFASPLLGRLGLGGRLVAGVLVLGLFGFVTRWEPSVLRAVAMASLTLLASTLGRPVSGRRVLALAVTAVLLVDPMLVGSVSFLLSVGACGGIALFARGLADALPGPRPLVSALAVTVAAQLGVAPVFVPVFGGLPVAALAANVLALPAAGPVMMWGLAAGLPAGLVGGAVAHVVHLPTRLLVEWIAGVARISAELPLGELRWPHVVVLTAAASLLVTGARRWRAVALLLAAVTIASPVFVDRTPRTAWAEPIADGARLWQTGGVAVLEVQRASPAVLFPVLRRWRVRRIDVLVVGRTSAQESARALTGRVATRVVLDEVGSEVDAGLLRVRLEPERDRIVTVVRRVSE
jgi:competence protein ComEC